MFNSAIRKGLRCILLNLFFFTFIFSKALSQDITYDLTTTISLGTLFHPDADISGGIIATLPEDGKVTLTVHKFDVTGDGQKGEMIYQVYIPTTTTQYQGIGITIPHADLGGLMKYMVGDWDSKSIKQAALAMNEKISTDRNEAPQYQAKYSYPVVVELIVSKGATVSSVKIPGIGIIPFKSFTTDHFQKVLSAIKNPLNYPDYTIVAAHRGYWKDVPENSFEAYDLCIAAGSDMVELDTRLTKDNVLVAFHDECLDRITDGTGKLRDMNWADVQKLHLRDRFGNVTGFRMVSIEDALEYLKGRALVNLDIKERITKNPDGSISDLLTPTFKSALQLAKKTETLNQLVIKGKLDADDMQDVLDDVGVTLDDFLYTPVAFGWDTPNMNSFVNDWLQENIPGIELTYKVSYDPILRYIPKAINKNRRVGIYTMWPEDCYGVIAEDNINDPKNYCKFNYRQYYFLNENQSGSVPVLSGLIPSNPSNGSNISEGGSDDYGGGSYDNLNPKAPRKLTKPDFMNDGRGDWDWLFNLGADFVITDRPVLMVQYLQAMGKRNLETPVITEVSLPDCPILDNGTGGSNKFNTIRGMVRRISDYREVEFFTPDTRNINIDTNLIVDSLIKYSGNKTRQWSRNFLNENHYCHCSDVYNNLPEEKIREFPLHTLPEWSVLYPGYDIYINGNWFDVKEPFPVDKPKERIPIPKAPYKMPCTDVFGFWKSSTGTILSRVEDPDPDHNNLDAVILDKTTSLITMVKSSDVPSYENNKSLFAIGGYIIAVNGVPIPYKDLPSGSSKTTPKKKTLIGINGYEMYIAEFQVPMLETYQAADLMVKYFNCKDVFMVDGGGSATMLSTRGKFPAVSINVGDNITSGSAGEDRNIQDIRVYRPVPNFLAIRVKQ